MVRRRESLRCKKRARDSGGPKVQAAEADGRAQREKDRQRRVEAFEEQIRCYSGPDPLELRIAYIKWALDCSVPGGQGGFEIGLLERCAREFADSDVYKDDSRYLNVWLKYADMVDDPLQIFSFLETKSIGSHLSARYIAHARVLEAKGRLDEVAPLLQQATQRGAEPLRDLQGFQRAFRRRCTAGREVRWSQQQQASASSHPQQRPAQYLLDFGSPQTRESVSRKKPRVTSPRFPGGALAGRPNVRAPFEIFNGHPNDAAPGTGGAAPPGKQFLPPREDDRKENQHNHKAQAKQRPNRHEVASGGADRPGLAESKKENGGDHQGSPGENDNRHGENEVRLRFDVQALGSGTNEVSFEELRQARARVQAVARPPSDPQVPLQSRESKSAPPTPVNPFEGARGLEAGLRCSGVHDMRKRVKSWDLVKATVVLGAKSFSRPRLLGTGGFARVYQSDGLCLKVHSPPYLHDHVISQRIRSRMGRRELQHFVLVDESFVARNHSIAVQRLVQGPTLEALVNSHMRGTEKLEPARKLQLAVELIRLTTVLHRHDILHADIKPDNVIVSPQGLRLIDFGRSIDLRDHAAGSLFSGGCHVAEFQCIEARIGLPWVYQIDTFGVFATLHCLFFGEYPSVSQRAARGSDAFKWKISQSERRQPEPWRSAFEVLLNRRPTAKQEHLAMLQDLLQLFSGR